MMGELGMGLGQDGDGIRDQQSVGGMFYQSSHSIQGGGGG